MPDDIKDSIDRSASAAKDATDRAADGAKSAADRMRHGAEQARDAFKDRVVEPAKQAGESLKESGQKIAQGSSLIGSKLIDQAENNPTGIRRDARSG